MTQQPNYPKQQDSFDVLKEYVANPGVFDKFEEEIHESKDVAFVREQNYIQLDNQRDVSEDESVKYNRMISIPHLDVFQQDEFNNLVSKDTVYRMYDALLMSKKRGVDIGEVILNGRLWYSEILTDKEMERAAIYIDYVNEEKDHFPIIGNFGSIMLAARVFGVNIGLLDTSNVCAELYRVNDTDDLVLINEQREVLSGTTYSINKLFPFEGVLTLTADQIHKRDVTQNFMTIITRYDYQWRTTKQKVIMTNYTYTLDSCTVDDQMLKRENDINEATKKKYSALQPIKMVNYIPSDTVIKTYFDANVALYNRETAKYSDYDKTEIGYSNGQRMSKARLGTSFYPLSIAGDQILNCNVVANDTKLYASMYGTSPKRLFTVGVAESIAVITIARVYLKSEQNTLGYDTLLTCSVVFTKAGTHTLIITTTYIEKVNQSMLINHIYGIHYDRTKHEVSLDFLHMDGCGTRMNVFAMLDQSAQDRILNNIKRLDEYNPEMRGQLHNVNCQLTKFLDGTEKLINKHTLMLFAPDDIKRIYKGRRLDYGLPLMCRDALAQRYSERTYRMETEQTMALIDVKRISHSYITGCVAVSDLDVLEQEGLIKLPCGAYQRLTTGGLHKHNCTMRLHALTGMDENTKIRNGYKCKTCLLIYNSNPMALLCDLQHTLER